MKSAGNDSSLLRSLLCPHIQDSISSSRMSQESRVMTYSSRSSGPEVASLSALTQLQAIKSQIFCRVLGNFTLSEQDVVDETYLFKGSQNSLILTQSYTHDFQCVYQLERHPFDTQVRFGNFFSNHRCLSRNC